MEISNISRLRNKTADARQRRQRRRAAPFGVWLAAIFFLTACPVLRAVDEDDEVALLTKGLGVSLWDESFNIRTGVGYDDNVYLNDTRVRGSGFFANGADVTIFRLPVSVWDYYFFLTGDDERYWRDIGVGGQDLWLGAAKITRDFGDAWQAGGVLSYAYNAQVLDLLTAEGIPSAEPTLVVGNMFSFRPFARRALGTNWWVELAGDITRQIYGSPAFSYWHAGPKISLGFNYGHHSDVTLSYAILDQPFDTEPRAALDGSSLSGPRLAYLTQKVDLTWRHHWDEAHAWATTTRFSFDSVSDNGSGFFNYYRYGISEQMEYAAHGWTLTATASLQYYNYPHQIADDPELSTLYETGVTLGGRVERRLTDWVKVFADYEFEHTFSDDFVEAYVVNTVKGGLLWQF